MGDFGKLFASLKAQAVHEIFLPRCPDMTLSLVTTSNYA
jgi:hypothetical protein